MSLQYFETLKQLGEGAATKFIFPHGVYQHAPIHCG